MQTGAVNNTTSITIKSNLYQPFRYVRRSQFTCLMLGCTFVQTPSEERMTLLSAGMRGNRLERMKTAQRLFAAWNERYQDAWPIMIRQSVLIATYLQQYKARGMMALARPPILLLGSALVPAIYSIHFLVLPAACNCAVTSHRIDSRSAHSSPIRQSYDQARRFVLGPTDRAYQSLSRLMQFACLAGYAI